ncbi:MAG: hypothetical protein GF365_02920, partial [Candidatus Buchananbacteria bacterium]|nr:hypothetical protein [Candidatus Buchananbacteria bacterium]
MNKKLRKLLFWKFFNNKIKLIFVLAFFIFGLSLSQPYFVNNTGAYPFTEADEYYVLDDPRHAIEGDFDNDGNLDLAVVNFRASYVSVSLNNGDATFKEAVHYQSGGIGPLSVATGDFDNDTDLDLAVVNYIDDNVRILLNNGSGVFSLDPTIYTAGTRPSYIISEDFDKDGNYDLAVTNELDDNFSILLNDGTGGFSAPTNYNCGVSPMQIVSADLDNDTNLDLIIVNSGLTNTGNSLSINFGNGDSTFNAPVSQPTPIWRVKSVTAADFDNDADLDLAVTAIDLFAQQSRLYLLDNDGTGSFTLLNTNYYNLSQRSVGLIARDYNNDGNQDVAVTDFFANTVSVLPGNGDLTFGALTGFNVGAGPYYILSADFDSDGKADIISLNKGENVHSYSPLKPMNNSFSFLRNKGVNVIENENNSFVSEQGIEDSYGINLSSTPTNDVVITFNYTNSQIELYDGSDVLIPNGGTITFTGGVAPSAQTIKIKAVDDAVAEGEHYSLITHSAASLDLDFNALKIPNVNVQIADNDQAGITIYESADITRIIEGGITDQYSLVLNSAPSSDVTVNLSYASDQMTASSDTVTFTPLNWDTPQTITVTAIDDEYVEGLEQRTISHAVNSTDPNYNGMLVSDIEVNVLDNNFLNHNPFCVGLMGDLVYNFQVNGQDLEILKQMVTGSAPPDNCGDLDFDGIISSGDISVFKNYITFNYYETAEVIIL